MAYKVEGSTLWQESVITSVNEQATYLQSCPDGPVGYRLRRIILVNFWLYDQQIFEIPHGRLFLAGENASGKSTVLVAAITLALDGDFRPERIDTFGKREKRIDYYVLGSKESATPFTRDSRTSYIALEFEWCDKDQPPFASELRTRWERGEYNKARFLTIGIVFAGNRNSASPINPTRFLITDGSRLGDDLPIVQQTKEGSRAYDARTFKKLFAHHGIICDTQREYEQKVAQYLFNFSNVQDFRRLIKQLLYLRQPNLNSILSLEAVRTYLDESLPQIPDDLIQQAATTLELMDTLREEIERRKKAYNATEKLHQAQVALTMSKVHYASNEYVHEQFQEEKEQNNLRRLKSNITRSTNDLARITGRMQELAQEQSQITGEVAALENSEGLQAAQRLHQVSFRVNKLEGELRDQQSILNDALSNREQGDQRIKQHEQDFLRLRQENEQQLQVISCIAEQDALWSTAAEQVAAVLQQVSSISLNDAVPNVSTQISSLMEVPTSERLAWLRTMRGLHQNIERETATLHSTQQLERRYYEEVDESTRQFVEAHSAACAAQQDLADMLDGIVEECDLFSFLPSAHFSAIHERAIQVCNEALVPREATEQFAAVLRDYSQAIKQALGTTHAANGRLQRNLDDLRQDQGAKELEAAHAETAYKEKLQEPEFVPMRFEHRALARQRLATHGIPALPLYMLIDFVPEIDNQSPEAGQIEYMLADAGLLDALVVLPSHTLVADTLLQGEGLSDCRLDIGQMIGSAAQQNMLSVVECPLRIDPAIRAMFGESYGEWEEIIPTILTAIVQTLYTMATTNGHSPWKHGLLAGQAGPGNARCIGKSTRMREQQRAQECLYQCWQKLGQELQDILERIRQTEQRQQTLRSIQVRLEGALKESGFESRSHALQPLLDTLMKAQERYNQARTEAQTLRQRINGIKAQLQRTCGEIVIFASDAAKVELAFEGTSRLASEYRALHSHLEHMLRAWQGYKQAHDAYNKARAAELRAASACERKEQETRQARSELATLERLVQEASGENIANLLERLRALQERLNALPDELQNEQNARVRAETNLANYQQGLEEALLTLEKAQHRRLEAAKQFVALLGSYPVETLMLAQQRLATNNALDIAQGFLATLLLAEEEAYLARKMILEAEKNTASTALYTTYSEVRNLLHDYGPLMNEQNFVYFNNADNANPFELLTRLSEEIKQQERLLDDKERVLFQDFLLQEMADTIRKHIIDAEGWVERINAVLASTAFIGEHYQLKWVANGEDQARLGSYLAQYHTLLRRQAQTLKKEEVDALVHAFRQEVTALRANLQGTTSLPFAEALTHIFDYRTWFRFEIYVISTDGQQRQHLSNRLLKKRSGAEQYVALYVPFFAALSALYESAGKGAPRLIALDEAFDKVSVANTRLLLKFLTSQQFQWIMTGPRVTGEGTEIPACVRYLMLHKKGSELATGFASFWSTVQPATTEE